MAIKYVPRITFEEIVVPAISGEGASSYGRANARFDRFRNPTREKMELHALVFDPNGTDTLVKLSVRGADALVDDWVHMATLNNHAHMNRTNDDNQPTLLLRHEVEISPRTGLNVEIEDKSGNQREVNAHFTGRAKGSSFPRDLDDREVIAASSTKVMALQRDIDQPILVSAVNFYIEEAASAAKLRQTYIRIKGGGQPDWMDERVPMTLFGIDRGSVPEVMTFEPGTFLDPGAGFDIGLLNPTDGAVTVRIGMIGYVTDRR